MLTFRPFSEMDSIAELTRMLHRAYHPLADAGMHFTASHQNDETTRFRSRLDGLSKLLAT